MTTCQYDIRTDDGAWVPCGRPALEVTVRGPEGAWDYELCPEHFAEVVSDRVWTRQAHALLPAPRNPHSRAHRRSPVR